MKKIIIATFALLGVIFVQAQKGSVLLGTDFSYERTDGYGDTKANEFTFSPVIAYEIADNWFLGAKTSLAYGEASAPDLLGTAENTAKVYSTKVGGFVRYYQPLLDNVFGVYGDLGAGYQQYRQNVNSMDYATGVTTTLTDDSRVRQYGYYINFVPALFVNFKNNFGLNISFGGIEWNDTKTNYAGDYDNSVKSRSFDLTFGKALSVGVTKKFTF